MFLVCSKTLDWNPGDIATLDNDFQYYELALSVKSAAIKATLAKERTKESFVDSIKDEVTNVAYHQLLRTATLAREAKKYQVGFLLF